MVRKGQYSGDAYSVVEGIFNKRAIDVMKSIDSTKQPIGRLEIAFCIENFRLTYLTPHYM